MRTDPAVSVPIDPKHRSAARAAAGPPDDPPAWRSSAHGLWTGPKTLTVDVPPYANSCRFRVFRGHAILEELARARRPHSGGIDVVLGRDRHAVQRPAPLAAALLGVHVARGRARLLAHDGDVRIHRRIEPVDPRETGLRQFNRRDGLAANKVGRALQAQLREFARRGGDGPCRPRSRRKACGQELAARHAHAHAPITRCRIWPSPRSRRALRGTSSAHPDRNAPSGHVARSNPGVAPWPRP